MNEFRGIDKHYPADYNNRTERYPVFSLNAIEICKFQYKGFALNPPDLLSWRNAMCSSEPANYPEVIRFKS